MNTALLIGAALGGGVALLGSRQARGADQSILQVLKMDNVTAALQPRGIRNNNPLNIEKGDSWRGLAAEQGDSRFAQFIDPRYGYRAGAIILRNYARRGVTTLAQILGTWAPKEENDLRAYIDDVARRSGLAPFQVVKPWHYVALFAAMTWHENGEQPYDLALIAEGVSWA